MTITFNGGLCHVVREKSDPKIYRESTLWYRIKRALIAQGHDVIAKRMWKDGHLVSDSCIYVRSRNMKRPGAFMLHDNAYALRRTYEPYNAGKLTLELHRESTADVKTSE